MTTVQYTVAELAKQLGAEFRGDGNCVINGVAPLDLARPGQASFLVNGKYRKYLANTQASVVILSPKEAASYPKNTIITDNPHLAYARVAGFFQHLKTITPEIHPTAIIGASCNIPASVHIGPNVIIGEHVTLGEAVTIGAGSVVGDNCIIGDRTKFYPRTTLYSDVTIGKDCILHSGVVIGADGFGFAQSPKGWVKVPQTGGVIIGDEVEIGANSTIDRGAIENTVIEQGVKIDNQVQIGHNVHIGAHSIIAGCAGIAGSTKIGKRCMIGGGACIVGHIEIVDDVLIAGMTGIAKSIKEPGIYTHFIQSNKRDKWLKNIVHLNHLDEIVTRLKTVESLIVNHQQITE